MNDRWFFTSTLIGLALLAVGLSVWALSLPPAGTDPFFVSVDGVVYECVEEDAIICSQYD